MIETPHKFKDSTLLTHPSTPHSHSHSPLTPPLSPPADPDPSPTYQQLNLLFLQQRKVALQQKQELLKTQIQFQKFNKLFQKQIQYVEEMAQRIKQEESQFQKQILGLKEKYRNLEMVCQSRERVIEMVSGRVVDLLVRGGGCGVGEIQKIESENPEMLVGLLGHLDHLERMLQQQSTRLKEQDTQILHLQSQTNLLKQSSKSSSTEFQRLKQRLKVTESTLIMAQEDKRRINNEWLQQIQQDRMEQISMRDFKNIIGAMKVERKELKKRNEELVQEVQRLMGGFGERLEGLVGKVNRLEYEKGKEREETRNRMRQFSS